MAGGKGGTEEFYNLNAHVRYVRLLGVARATQYGYSLFEVEFKSPGSENSLPALSTSAVPYPANGDALANEPAVKAPLETVQFSLPDGTLVTRFGMVGRSRHARERGEDWNEIGYGPMKPSTARASRSTRARAPTAISRRTISRTAPGASSSSTTAGSQA